MLSSSKLVLLLLAAVLVLLAIQVPGIAAQGNNGGGGGGGGGNANNGGGGNANNGGGNANNGGGNANNGGGGNANNGEGSNNGGGNSNNGGDLIGEGPGVISGGDVVPGAVKFLWPLPDQSQPWWQVPVIAKGSKTRPLNISWTLEGLANDRKPSRVVLQYYRESNRDSFTNITILPASETKFNWEIPAEVSFVPARDYKLKLSDAERPQEGAIAWEGISSGRFQVYGPANFTAAAAQDLDSPSSAIGASRVSMWMAVVGAGALGVTIMM